MTQTVHIWGLNTAAYQDLIDDFASELPWADLLRIAMEANRVSEVLAACRDGTDRLWVAHDAGLIRCDLISEEGRPPRIETVLHPWPAVYGLTFTAEVTLAQGPHAEGRLALEYPSIEVGEVNPTALWHLAGMARVIGQHLKR